MKRWQVQKRTVNGGKTRYTAMYYPTPRKGRSAGTFTSRAKAEEDERP
jgi:hypothetical protein